MLLIYNFFYFLSFCVSFRFIQFSRFPHVGKTRWRPEENGSSIAWLQRLHYNGKLGRNRAVLWWQHGHFARLARLEPCTQWGNGNGRWTRGIPPGVQKEKEQNKTETPANWARKHKKKKNKSLQWLHNKRFFPGATRKPRNVKFMSFSKTHSIRSLYPPFKVTPAPIIYVHMYIYIHSHLTYALAYRIYLFMTHRVKSICLLIFISKFMFSFWSNYVVNVLWPQPLAMGIMLFEEKELLIVIWWSYPVNGWKELKTSAKVVLLLEMY